MQKVIGIIGPIASGKDSTAAYIATKTGAPIYQISAEITKIAIERKIPIERSHLIELSRELTREHGDDFLTRRLLQQHAEPTIILVGMRQIGQIEYLRKNASLLLIGITADEKTRFQRVLQRKKEGDPDSIESFKEIETQDDGPFAQKVSTCMEMADRIIVNEGSLSELENEIDRALVHQK